MWVDPTPQDLFDHVLASNDERFPMICDDLRLMPRRPPVLVEGPRLFPKYIEPVLKSPRQAIRLLPTEAFARARGLPFIEIDGERSVEDVADEVDAHFAGYLESVV